MWAGKTFPRTQFFGSELERQSKSVAPGQWNMAARGCFPNITGTTCWIASACQSLFATDVGVECARRHEASTVCGQECFARAYKRTEAESATPGSSVSLADVWQRALKARGSSALEQDDVLAFTDAVLEQVMPQESMVSTIEKFTLVPNCSCAAQHSWYPAVPAEHAVHLNVAEKQQPISVSEVLSELQTEQHTLQTILKRRMVVQPVA